MVSPEESLLHFISQKCPSFFSFLLVLESCALTVFDHLLSQELVDRSSAEQIILGVGTHLAEEGILLHMLVVFLRKA